MDAAFKTPLPPRARPSANPALRSCLRRFSGQNQPRVRLVCFAWCGAGASVYRRLALSLPQAIELQAVQLPGREERFAEPKLLRMEQIIADVLPDIVAFNDGVPLVFFGHSMGALVAYEMALALKAKTRREPALVIVSGHGSPDTRDHCKEQWHTACEDEFIANIARLGGTPAAILADRAAMRTLIPALKSDYEVLETWVRQPGTPLSCPLVACAGDQDNEVCPATLQSWQHFTTGRFTGKWFSGDHFYLCAQPRLLTRALEHWITEEVEGFSAALA